MNREEAIMELNQFSGTTQLKLSANFWTALNMAIKTLEQEPCEDCISREQAIKATYGFERYTGIDEAPYEYAESILRDLPPVTPTRKKGKWIGRKKIGFGEWEDVTVFVNPKGCVTDSVECSNCGNWLTGSDEYECDARYCPNCGAEMESEE